MLLWDIIRDWFVQYVFGGFTSVGQPYGGRLGQFMLSGGNATSYRCYNIYFPINMITSSNEQVIGVSVGDWLSTTATLIVMISVCVALWFLVRYFFRMFAGLISGR